MSDSISVAETPRTARDIVLDTSALLYWTLAPERLSSAARHGIESSPRRLILSVSLWEIALKNARGGIELPIPIEEYLSRLERAEGVAIHDLSAQTAIDGALLEWHHRDPADRWITAFARRLNLPLVTSDQRIRAFYPRVLW